MVEFNFIELLLAASHDILGIVMVIYIAFILNQFRGLPKLERPWWSMIGALIIFLVASIIRTMQALFEPISVVPPNILFPFINVAVSIFETFFIAVLALSIYYFKKAWEEPA